MWFLAGCVAGLAVALYAPYAIVMKGISGRWPWERPFSICEYCWWSGRTKIHEYAPCPRCHKWFMRTEGFNITLETMDLYLEYTGKTLVGVRPVPIEGTISDWGGLASKKDEIICRDREGLRELGYLEK